MRKRLKKKKELKQEIRHAQIMRGFDLAQRIIQNAIMISQIGRKTLLGGVGVVVGVNNKEMSQDQKKNLIDGLENLKNACNKKGSSCL